MSKKESKARGGRFEAEIGRSFEFYAKKKIAYCEFMPIPTVPIHLKWDNRPVRILSGKAPFDVYGLVANDGRFIGAELKDSQRKNSLAIIAPDKTGSGVQFHQLDALVNVARNGGIARIVWSNAGEVGILTGPKIIQAWQIYTQALTSERSGKDVARGTKSISWEQFITIDYTTELGGICLDWLRTDLFPC